MDVHSGSDIFSAERVAHMKNWASVVEQIQIYMYSTQQTYAVRRCDRDYCPQTEIIISKIWQNLYIDCIHGDIHERSCEKYFVDNLILIVGRQWLNLSDKYGPRIYKPNVANNIPSGALFTNRD